MRVTILGSGTAVPVPERFPAGVLVEGEGRTVLVDAGPGVLRRLAQAGVGLERLDAVLLTHFHTDHTGDVPALLFALRNPRYAGRPPLALRGGRGLAEFLGGLAAAWPGWLKPRGYELAADEVEPGRFAIGGLAVTAVRIAHTEASLAYRFEDAGGRVAAISGDAAPCEGLVEVARDADLFVCESAFPEAHALDNHLTPARAGRAAREASARRLCLTHFYPECEGHDLLAECRREYSGEVHLAEDLLEFDLAAGKIGRREASNRGT